MRKAVVFTLLLTLGLGLSACAEMRQDPGLVAKNIIIQAAETVERFKTVPELKQFAKHIPGARAVVVLPRVIKAGFIAGGEGGNGVLIARDAKGKWGYPAFYTMGAASFGFQAGFQDTEIILVIRSEQALRAILDNQGKLGADAGVTIGFAGAGIEASTTSNMGADVVAFSNSRLGVFGGASLEGAVLARRRDLNEAFYGKGATPRGIVLAGKFSNPKAEPLRAALSKR